MKNKPYIYKLICAAVAAVFILFFQNCAEQNFSDMSSESVNFTTNTGGPSCRKILDEIQTPVELIFVVDVSGSNDNDDENTDPDKSIRAGSISRFLNEYKSKSNFDWTFLSFGNKRVDVRAENADPTGMNMALEWFMNHDDNGNTPYQKALDAIQSFVSNEAAVAPVDTKYLIVFLSDGRPSPEISDSSIEVSIKNTLAVSSGNVSFNTVYYGDLDQDSHDRLKFMAEVGGGHFLDTNNNPTGGSFNIGDLVVVPPVEQCEDK